jgi:putative lipoic acid-binding regulatory protein
VSSSDHTLLEFPCRFPIKIMGANEPDFTRHAMALVASHVDDLGENDVESRVSRNGRFLALTVHIQARSKAQLDAIYLSLSQSKRVLMAL